MEVPVELKRKYLERRVQDIEHLMSSLDKNDFAPAAKLGHQVKGNAVTFDFPQMEPIGKDIERAARERNKSELKNLVEKMDAVIQQARLTFH